MLVLLSANVGEHVERNVSLATSPDARLKRPVGLTALPRTDVFAFEPVRHHGSTHPPLSAAPAKNQLGEIGYPRLLCATKQVAPSRSLRALSQWTRGKEMKMIENDQNKTEFSGVCRCRITTYDKQSEVPRGALSAAESSGTPTFGSQTPVQYR